MLPCYSGYRQKVIFNLQTNINVYIKKGYKKLHKQNTNNIAKALDYFDSVYPNVYGEKKWKKMKEYLLLKPKYMALINNFSGDHESIANQFEEELGAFEVGSVYRKFVEKFQEKKKKKILRMSKIVKKDIMLDTEFTDCVKVELDSSEVDQHQAELTTENSSSEIVQDYSFSDRLVKGSQIGSEKIAGSFDHIPATKLKGLEDWVEEADPFMNEPPAELEYGKVFKRVKDHEPLPWPSNLQAYAFVRGEEEDFPSPMNPHQIATTHYLLNGSSLLPVIALNLQVGDSVLDMCCSPGGKSLAIMQTLLPGLLRCNDSSVSRLLRTKQIMHEYIPDIQPLKNIISYSKFFGTEFFDQFHLHGFFDKVLVDAPCLNDRLSLQVNDNNMFKHARLQERLNMPRLQADLIVNALKLAKPGGCVVYSTCSLSPLQNDGAVHLALTRLWRETKMECTIADMSPTMNNLRFMYKMDQGLQLRFGHLILPCPPDNYGPMYICKIIKNR